MHLSTSDAFEIFTNEYHNQTGDNMKKFELFMEVKIRVEDQKGRCVPEVLSYQVYEGDDLDRKYSGYSKTQSLDGKTIVVTYPVKVTKKIPTKTFSSVGIMMVQLTLIEEDIIGIQLGI